MQQKTLIFLHIPKTAGSTMRTILRQNYQRTRLLHVRMSMPAYRYALFRLAGRRRRFDLVLGHYGYGIHCSMRCEYEYLTMLRDPVQRAISQYYFDLARDFWRRPFPRGTTLERLIDCRWSKINDFQTRMLAAVDGRYLRGPIGPAELARAKANLTRCMVGIAERFDESLVLFKRQFAWSDIRYVSRNIGRNKPSELPARLIARLEEINQNDWELYALAKELVEKEIAEYRGDFQRDLEAFRILNRIASREGSLEGRSLPD